MKEKTKTPVSVRFGLITFTVILCLVLPLPKKEVIIGEKRLMFMFDDPFEIKDTVVVKDIKDGYVQYQKIDGETGETSIHSIDIDFFNDHTEKIKQDED